MENSKTEAVRDVKPRGWLGTIIAFLDKAIRWLLIFGTAISCTSVAAMMFLTFFNVSGRMAFDLPVKGYFELIELFMLLMTVFAIGYTATRKGHIRVDILANYLPRKVNNILDIVTYAVAFIFFIMVTWRGGVNGLDNFNDKLSTGVLHIPIYPFNFVLAVGTAILSVVFFRDCLKAIQGVHK